MSSYRYLATGCHYFASPVTTSSTNEKLFGWGLRRLLLLLLLLLLLTASVVVFVVLVVVVSVCVHQALVLPHSQVGEDAQDGVADLIGLER